MSVQNAEVAALEDLEKIFRAAVTAVDPARLAGLAMDGAVADAERIPAMVAQADRIFVLAIGKAAAGMAAGIAPRVESKLAGAIAVIPQSLQVANLPKAATAYRAAHPIPDESSAAAARAALAMLRRAAAGDLIIIAIGGGASAMFAAPAPGLELSDKIAITRALLNSGAPIREFNLVRKHLSAVKGGQLLRACGSAQVLGIVISDVPGNDLATIGSGLTAPDPSTYAEAISVLKRRRLWGRAPEAVRGHLERGAAGAIPETIKPGDPAFARVTNVVVGDNETAIAGAMRAAAALDYAPERWRELRGEADEIGRAFATDLAAIDRDRVCLIAGGEPIVTVRGNGKGGRAQQCALSAALEMARTAAGRRIAILCAGTDGIDGPTDAAGAFASPGTVESGARAEIDAASAFKNNDAYNFFAAAGGLFVTGPTGANAGDLAIGLIN
ncbi:MAG: glycerate kinase type-2 family protein [Candidatus Binataceae bacterium]